jgi:uncharacterized phage protein (TIGR02220 family)
MRRWVGSRGLNYYPHHIGDFNNATRHLTRVERALYRELIELYYDTEKPLPADDFEWICRKVLAYSETEKVLVQNLLGEFFILDGKLFRHDRCDEEIAVFKAKQEAAVRAGRASAKKRANGKATRVQRSFNGRSTDVQPTKNQEPRANNHKVQSIVGLRPDALQVLNFLNEKTGRSYEPVPANVEMIVARMKEGATVEDCKAVVAKKCREWASDEKMSIYLRPATLFNRTKFAQYRGELGAVAA